jgi:hypothetical protein
MTRRNNQVCDYSLMGIPNRLAKSGEDLAVYKFQTGSLGFASRSDLGSGRATNGAREGFWSALWKSLFTPPKPNRVPAVCVPPGARLLLQDISVRLQYELEIGSVEEVSFTELTAMSNSYRDAVVFKNGRHVLLQRLEEGQRAKVLAVSSADAKQPYQEWLHAGTAR